MTITRNLTAEIYSTGATVTVEISDDTDMIHTFTVRNGGNFVRAIDRKLTNAFFQRTTAWENLPDQMMTFKVDHYGE